jgi:hypothetical protein
MMPVRGGLARDRIGRVEVGEHLAAGHRGACSRLSKLKRGPQPSANKAG